MLTFLCLITNWGVRMPQNPFGWRFLLLHSPPRRTDKIYFVLVNFTSCTQSHTHTFSTLWFTINYFRNYFDPSLNPETDTEEVEAESGLRRRRSLSAAPPVAKIRLQGPFGGGNQDWYKFEVAVMIGAGEGKI